jgi:hypothetical protein
MTAQITCQYTTYIGAAVLSNLKTFLETGRALPAPPWAMLPGFVR